MQIKLDTIIEKFDAMAIRLRILFTFCIVAIIYFLFDAFWFSANDKSIESGYKKIAKNKKQITELLSLQEESNKKMTQKRNDPRIKQIESLDNQLKDIRGKLKNYTLNLIQPEDMAKVVRTVIESSKPLTIDKFEKRETINLAAQKKKRNVDTDEKKPKKEKVKLYRHSMEIKLNGNYYSALNFLKALENMEKSVSFDKFEYQVDEYPKANLTLVISTLSLNKEWIGG